MQTKKLPLTALIIAHPGHEACIYGWLATEKPLVCILTDGSGREGESRLQAASQLLAEVGADQGPIFGRYTEREIYDAVLNSQQDDTFFIRLARELALLFVERQIEMVVGDASEGYNSTHEVWRLVMEAAVEIARRWSGRPIARYEFAVVGAPGTCALDLREQAIWHHLVDQQFSRKIAAARKYYPELLDEMEAALSHQGTQPMQRFRSTGTQGEEGEAHCEDLSQSALEVFRIECLRPIRGTLAQSGEGSATAEVVPFYERHGRAMVNAGHYEHYIGYRTHIRPLARALNRYVGSEEWRENSDG